MKTINERLKGLQPYVAGIRFVKDLSVIDTFFKEGWTLPKSTTVGNEVTADKPNYYMLYPTTEETGLDEMLDYVENIIFLNEEREQKLALLKEKIRELQILFRDKSLVECKTLEFTFKAKTINADEFSLTDIPLTEENVEPTEEPIVEPTEEKEIREYPEVVGDRSDIDEWNKSNRTKVGSQTIELPPKKEKIELETFEEPMIVCNCGPNDVCPVCVEG